MIHPLANNIDKRRKRWYQICREAEEDIDKIVTHSSLDDTRQRMENYIQDLMKLFTELLKDAINETIEETLKHYNEEAPFSLPADFRKRVKNYEESVLEETYYGKTTLDRIIDLQNKTIKNIHREIDTIPEHDIDKEILSKRIYEKVYSEMPVPGGRLFNSGDSILTGEQTRFYHNTTLKICDLSGVQHIKIVKVEQSSSACKELADRTPDFLLTEKCQKEGISEKGVYRLENAPDMPHPRAMYYIKLLFSLGYSPLL